jgi:hypothetical protein
MGGRPIAQQMYPDEYSVWQGMKTRCLNPNSIEYQKYYGGKGIDIDPRWISSIVYFVEDMGHRPSPLHTLDRIDNNKGYWKWNCRWATKTEQMHNRRDNVLSETDIEDIRSTHLRGIYKQWELAQLYKVRPDYISAIIRNVIWR